MKDMSISPSPRTSPLARRSITRYPLSAIDQGERILAALGSLRFATAIQVRRAVFNGSSERSRQARHRATKALRRLFDAGFINRVQVFCPSAFSDQLSLQVAQTLSATGARAIGLDPKLARSRAPRPRSVLAHDFWLTELGVLALEGCPEGLIVTHWWNDRVLSARKRLGRLSLPTIPDGLLVVRNLSTGRDHPCLVELDLGTESVTSHGRVRPDFSRKIEGYLEYLGAPFRRDFGIDAPPILLIVADSERRLISLKAVAERLGGGGRFWFATLPALRGLNGSASPSKQAFAARKGAFWGSNWSVPNQNGRRSLAACCGA